MPGSLQAWRACQQRQLLAGWISKVWPACQQAAAWRSINQITAGSHAAASHAARADGAAAAARPGLPPPGRIRSALGASAVVLVLRCSFLNCCVPPCTVLQVLPAEAAQGEEGQRPDPCLQRGEWAPFQQSCTWLAAQQYEQPAAEWLVSKQGDVQHAWGCRQLRR